MDGTDGAERTIGVLIGKVDGMTAILSDTQTQIRGLRDDFQSMEKGRLTRLEVEVATLRATQEQRNKDQEDRVDSRSRNTSIIWSLIGSGTSGIIVYILTLLHH